jgi:hypothetical protein
VLRGAFSQRAKKKEKGFENQITHNGPAGRVLGGEPGLGAGSPAYVRTSLGQSFRRRKCSRKHHQRGLNGDGKPDLATANFVFPSNNVSGLLTTTTGVNYMGFIYGSPNNKVTS